MYQALVTYTDGSQEKMALKMQETGRGFIVTLPRDELHKPVETVDFMPDFAPAKEGEDGYIIYRNYMIRFKNHEDQRIDTGFCQQRMMGVKTPRECFVCIMTGMWEYHRFIIERKDGIYTIHPRFLMEGQQIDGDFQAEYVMLTGEDADYSGMARAYQDYQLNTVGCKMIRDRMNPELEYVLDAPEIRIRQAWKPVPTPVEEQTDENEPPMHVAATFDRVGEVMDACKAHGVDKAEFCLVGWNISGHDGRWPQAFPVEEKLGGEEGLKKLTKKARDLGYRLVCHTNSTDCYSISNRWSDQLPMRTRDGEKQKNAQWGGGRMYNMCPKAGGEKFSMEDLPKVKELGFHGLHYIDVISCVAPYRCFDKEHPCTQKEFIASMTRIAKRASELMGGFQSEGAYDYMAPVSDMFLYVDFGLFNPPKMVDENVPMWQLCYHGIVLSNPAPATVNYPVKDWQSQLKFIEYGGHPAVYIHSKFVTPDPSRSNWMGDVDITCGSPEEIEEAATHISNMLTEYRKIKDLQLMKMTHHKREGDLATTTYEDGTRIICNYGEASYFVDGVDIPAHQYAVVRA